jgi:outer membrane protein TolC
MMKNSIAIILLLLCAPLAAQQRIDEVLQSVTQQNTTLKALRESANAQQLENRTNIFLPGPEVGFNYLWGAPQAIGNRTDISVSQTFDFATILGLRSKTARQQNALLELEYRTSLMNILLEAKQYCIEVVYYNALKKALNLRLQHAETMARSYRARLDRGDVSVLEYNKAQLNLTAVQGEMARATVEQKAALQALQRLNGGIAVALDDDSYAGATLPASFDAWFEAAMPKSPVLEAVNEEVSLRKRQVGLARAANWPALSAGYMSERVTGETFQGVTLGLSIPLWGNKNRTKQAKAAVRAAERKQADMRLQLYAHLQSLYDRAAGLRDMAAATRRSLHTLNNAGLLQKALDAGEISLLDYLMEVALYYDAVTRALEAERDYEKAMAELLAVETM